MTPHVRRPERIVADFSHWGWATGCRGRRPVVAARVTQPSSGSTVVLRAGTGREQVGTCAPAESGRIHVLLLETEGNRG